jgi:hypothetical protein
MRSRAVRLTLTLLAVAAIASAAFLFITIGRASNTAADAARDLDARIDSATRQALELRGAQQAYVAAGQSEQFWLTKSAATLAALRESLTAIRSALTAPGSQMAIDEAVQTVQEFERMDKRAREYATTGQKLLASDLIFSDGLEATAQVLTALDQVRGVEADAVATAREAAWREQLLYIGAAAGVSLIAILLLVPVPGGRIRAPAQIVTPHVAMADDLDLGPARDSRVPAAPAAPSPPDVDLEAVATVCRELAQVSDTAALPALLERTATALDATGIVIWIADPDGRELTPIVSHGYPASMLSRMGTLRKDADNLTAAAFRTGLLQVVKGDATSNGGIAAPLVNPGGCIGVMSAEVRNDGETAPARLAVATIVAAQFATLVAPPAARDNRTAAL